VAENNFAELNKIYENDYLSPPKITLLKATAAKIVTRYTNKQTVWLSCKFLIQAFLGRLVNYKQKLPLGRRSITQNFLNQFFEIKPGIVTYKT
jgi:hypothetical protein